MKYSSIKISVVMPSLNVADYISECLYSVMNQTLKEIEIICIDAGSTDGTLEILYDLQQKDERIHVVKSNIRSYGYQVNLGISLSRGEYISIIETDDYIECDMYRDLYKFAIENECDYIKGNYFTYFTQKNGQRFFNKRKNITDSSLYYKVLTPLEEYDVILNDSYLWSGIYKRSFLLNESIKFSETQGAAFQDIGFLFQVITKAERALYVSNHYYKYCIDRDGASSNSGKSLKYAYQEYKKIFENYNIKECNESIKYVFYARLLNSFMRCYKDISLSNVSVDECFFKYYNWVITQLKYAIDTNILSAGNINDSLLQNVTELASSEFDDFKTLDIKKKAIENVFGNKQESKVIIFGCGNYGMDAYRILIDMEYSVTFFMDNNSELWGKTINGIMIKPPSECLSMPQNTKYMIASERYFNEIYKQLMKLNVNEKDVYILNT